MRKLNLFLIFSLMVSIAFANTPLHFVGIRQAAMGGAVVAIADDINALHANPAGLVQIDGFHLNLMTMQESLGADILDKIGDLSTIAEGDDEQQQTEQLGSLIPLKLGFEFLLPLPLSYTGSTPAFLNILGSNMGVGGFAKGALSGEVVRPTLPTIKASARFDSAFILGFARDLPKGWIPFNTAIGYSLKYLVRWQQAEIRQSATPILNGETIGGSDSSTISGIGMDVGSLFMYDLPWLGQATVGLVFQNIGATLTGESLDVSRNVTDSNYQETIPVTAKVGVSFTRDMSVDWPVISLLNGPILLAADYDMFWPDATLWKRLHLGAEKRILGNTIALRGGLNQGYITAGFGVDLWLFHIGYAYYVEELGNEIGIDPFDYHIIELGISF